MDSHSFLLILRRHQTPAFRGGSKAPLSINPEQTPGFRPGIVEGLILESPSDKLKLELASST